MKPCFICAMEAEAESLLKRSAVLKETRLGFARCFHASYQNTDFYVCVSGIGKVLASSAATACLLAYPDIDAVINIGIGGSLNAEKAPLLSAVISASAIQHDMDTTFFGDPRGYLNGLDLVEIPSNEEIRSLLRLSCEELGYAVADAKIASGDRFVVEESDKQNIVDTFGCLMIDMETAAFAEVCHVYKKPFACLRIVSDAVDHINEYRKYKPIASKAVCDVALRILTHC